MILRLITVRHRAVYGQQSDNVYRITMQGLQFNILRYCKQGDELFHRPVFCWIVMGHKLQSPTWKLNALHAHPLRWPPHPYSPPQEGCTMSCLCTGQNRQKADIFVKYECDCLVYWAVQRQELHTFIFIWSLRKLKKKKKALDAIRILFVLLEEFPKSKVFHAKFKPYNI